MGIIRLLGCRSDVLISLNVPNKDNDPVKFQQLQENYSLMFSYIIKSFKIINTDFLMGETEMEH
jgi:hypothetical protein